MEDLLEPLAAHLATASEAFAVLVIGWAAVEALARALRLVARRKVERDREATQEIRLRLGRWLAVALEFLLAADVLRTAVAPSWDEIGKLSAIAVLRTGLNLFLQMEIEKAEAWRAERRAEAAPAGAR
jgi:uncharacterized membrane protein